MSVEIPEDIIFEIARRIRDDKDLENLVNSSTKYQRLFDPLTINGRHFWRERVSKKYTDKIYERLGNVTNWKNVYYDLENSDIWDQYLYISVGSNTLRFRLSQPESFDQIYKQILSSGNFTYLLSFDGTLNIVYGCPDSSINISEYQIDKLVKFEYVDPPKSIIGYYNMIANEKYKCEIKCIKVTAIDDEIIRVRTVGHFTNNQLFGAYLITRKGNVILFASTDKISDSIGEIGIIGQNQYTVVLKYLEPIRDIVIAQELHTEVDVTVSALFITDNNIFRSESGVEKLAVIPSSYDRKKLKLYESNVNMFTYNNIIFVIDNDKIRWYRLDFNILNAKNMINPINMSVGKFYNVVNDKFEIYDIELRQDGILYKKIYHHMLDNSLSISITDDGHLRNLTHSIGGVRTMDLSRLNIDKVIAISANALSVLHGDMFDNVILTIKRHR